MGLKQELEVFSKPRGTPMGSTDLDEQRKWFDDFIMALETSSEVGGVSSGDLTPLMPLRPPIRKVKVAPLLELRHAVNEAKGIQWDDKMERLAESIVDVLEDDDSDGTSQIRSQQHALTAWLLTKIL